MATYNDYPKAATEAAKKALRWKEQYGDEVKGGTAVGWTRANQLASRESLSYSTIARMAAFNRHRKNSKVDPKYIKTPWKDRGYVAWNLWGGTAGVDWAIRKAEGIREGRYSFAVDKVSFDYDDTLSTDRGMRLAKLAIAAGKTVYIISARQSKDGMLNRAKELGIPASRVFATGSNTEKVKKVLSLGIDKHYDNNADVSSKLGDKGIKF